MNQETTFDYQAYLDHLEEAIYWHLAWQNRLMGALLCGRAFEDTGHQHCHFGRWFNGAPCPPGRESEIAELAGLHVRLHETATDLLQSHEKCSGVDASAFAEFEEAQSLFFGTLHGLFRTVLSDACQG
ncbi:MAG: CZB domain-containing protein [Halothiobacillaceae bacterium]|jgi:hypothetical protein|nr:CZB domain-containing protein [Halothiobacillaceae bacterium]MDY0050787.1 CZB domain-containing protein [Halothiobacillaceae bacterium]